MKNWKLSLRMTLAIASTILLSSLGNTLSAYCAETCSRCPGIELGADFLYWTTCLDDGDFAAASITETGTGTTTQKFHYYSICPDWHPGVRIRLTRPDLWCNLEARFIYTWVETNDHDNAVRPTGGTITNLLLHPQFDDENAFFTYTHVKAKWNTNYNTFDLLFAYPTCLCDCQEWAPFFGVSSIILDQKVTTKSRAPEVTSFPDNIITSSWESDLWGVGLKVGADYKYPLCEGFKLIAQGSCSLLAGEVTNKNKQEANFGLSPEQLNLTFTDSEHCHLLPGYYLNAGIEYDTCICSSELTLRAGYEFTSWFNTPNPRRFFVPDSTITPVENSRSSSSSVSTFGLHGLFAGVDIKY